jgi:acetyl-CoA carboxylase carboxyltransferase component
VPVLADRLDHRGPDAAANRDAMLALLADLETHLDTARAGGGEKYVERHKKRGKLLPRERIELLVDRDSAFLELSPLAAYGSSFPVGASIVTGVGVVENVECMLIANDPTVRGGATNPMTAKKVQRAMEIARENRLPVINLVESGGADLPTQAEIFIPGGGMFRNLTRFSAEGIPTIALVLRPCRSEPAPGSLMAIAVIISPLTNLGSQRCFCSSVVRSSRSGATTSLCRVKPTPLAPAWVVSSPTIAL